LPEQEAKLVFRFDAVPIWEMLRADEQIDNLEPIAQIKLY